MIFLDRKWWWRQVLWNIGKCCWLLKSCWKLRLSGCQLLLFGIVLTVLTSRQTWKTSANAFLWPWKYHQHYIWMILTRRMRRPEEYPWQRERGGWGNWWIKSNRSTANCSAQYVLHWITLHLWCSALQFFIASMHFNALHCITLHCTTLHCIA